MPEMERDFPIPKTNFVLRYASAEASRQDARLEAFRSRAAAACFLGVSAGFRLTRSPDPKALADDYLYEDVAQTLYTFGLILLMLGTLIIGVRVAWLVL